MKQTKLFASAMLLSFSALTLSGLTACSKKEDAAPNSGTTTGGTTTTPTGKSHTVTFNYVNRGLDVVKVGTSTYNLGAGIRLYVDGKPLDLARTLASGDTTYYIQPQTPSTSIAFQNTFTVTGNTLKMEVGFYNVRGTQAQPLTIGGQTVSLAGTSLTLVPVVDGQTVTTSLVELVNMGSTAQPSYKYDNGRNPTRVLNLDLTKF